VIKVRSKKKIDQEAVNERLNEKRKESRKTK